MSSIIPGKYKFVLASASPRRKELVKSIGIDPIVIPADADESLPDEINDPRSAVMLLAERKARAVFDTLKKESSDLKHGAGPCVILGSDTVVVKDGIILGKPSDRDDAFRMLSLLQNNTHTVCTGIFLILADVPGGRDSAGKELSIKNTLADCGSTKVHFTKISDKEIFDYIDSGEPMDKAGSYGIQGSFAAFVDRIEGEYSNVVGLPLSLLYHSLKTLLE